MKIAPLGSFASRSGGLLRAGTFALIGTAATLAACGSTVDGGSRHVIFVRGALAPPAANQSGACVYTSDPSGATLFAGNADLGVIDQYTLTLLVDTSDPKVSTSIDGAHVVIREPDGTVLWEHSQVATGFVGAGGLGVVSLIAVDAPARELLLATLVNRRISKTVVVDIDLTGTDPATGVAAASPVFKFPLQVCNGCLVSFQDGEDPTQGVQPNCMKPLAAGAQAPCFPGQDQPVPCQFCVASRAVCDPKTP